MKKEKNNKQQRVILQATVKFYEYTYDLVSCLWSEYMCKSSRLTLFGGLVQALRLHRQRCIGNIAHQSRVGYQVGRARLPTSSLYQLKGVLAVPLMCSAFTLIAASHRCVYASVVIKARLLHWSLDLGRTSRLTNLTIPFSAS